MEQMWIKAAAPSHQRYNQYFGSCLCCAVSLKISIGILRALSVADEKSSGVTVSGLKAGRQLAF